MEYAESQKKDIERRHQIEVKKVEEELLKKVILSYNTTVALFFVYKFI